MNSTVPTLSSVSEYDEAMLEEFISNAKLLVNTLGYKTFESIAMNSDNSNNALYYIKAARGANAVGYPISDGFVVKQGSVIAATTTPSYPKSIQNFRDSLYSNGIISEDHILTKDHVFTSSSLAACVVMGRNANGRTEWKTKNGQTLKEIEESQNS